MQKLIVYALMTVVSGAAVGVALAATEATTFSAKQTTRAERASTGLKFKIGFSDPDAPNVLPSGLKSFKIKLHPGSKIDSRGAVQCAVTDEELMNEGVAACPPSSRIGSGTVTATNAAGTSVNADVAIFNDRFENRNAFLFVITVNDVLASAFDATIKGDTLSSEGLTGALPGDFVVSQFSGRIDKKSTGRGERRHNLITTPKVCPPGRKWTNTATFNFLNGEKDTGSSKSRCKP